MKGVILDNDSFDRGDIDLSPLENMGIEWTLYQSTKEEQARERIIDTDIVVTNKVKLHREAILAASNLKLVLIAATGTDNVDLTTCDQQRILVCNAREYSTPAVVQHVFTLMLNLVTNLPRYQDLVCEGKWQKSNVFCLLDYPIVELADKTLGIVGYGTLGRKVAEVAKAFGMKVLLCQRPGGLPQPGRIPLNDLLPIVDVLSLHCPLNSQTEKLLGRAEFCRMRSNAILINTARGAIIDSVALVHALKQGDIAGAGIDVLDIEPPSNEHPLIANPMSNLTVTPHNAWASKESRQRLITQLSNNLKGWLDGQPVNVVHP